MSPLQAATIRLSFVHIKAKDVMKVSSVQDNTKRIMVRLPNIVLLDEGVALEFIASGIFILLGLYLFYLGMVNRKSNQEKSSIG